VGTETALERCYLDVIGVRHGTHLSSLGRNCLGQWQRFLEPLRDRPFDLLEIGVGSGASLRMWREWFPFADLVGLEARRLMFDPPIAGSTIVHGSQTDFFVLQRILRDRRFRLIVDDGSRRPDDQIQTFLTLFPWLEPDSVYICASLPDSAAASGDGEPPDLAGVSWFTELGRALIADGSGSRPPGATREVDLVLQRATGVFLMRGSAIVTS
jgi:demethylmacrocin O-methyltransferase